MLELIKRRPKALAALAAGTVAVLAVGGVLAITSDTLRSNDTSSSTGTYTPPAHLLSFAAVTNPVDTCSSSGLGWSSSDALAVFSTTIDQELSYDAVGNPIHRVCLRNDGQQAAQLSLSVADLVDTEDADCLGTAEDAAEQALGGGCISAGGELSSVLDLFVSTPGYLASSSGSCSSNTQVRLSSAGLVSLDSTMPAGAVCGVELAVDLDRSPAVSEDQRLATQTDTVTWDFVFTAQDVV